jgi:myosin heavy subunit
VNIDHVTFKDNQGCLDLIDKSPFGLLPMLDEELVVPNGSDGNLNSRFKKQQRKSEYYVSVDARIAAAGLVNGQRIIGDGAGVGGFGVKHYAGKVYYSTDGFLQKNKNTTHAALLDLIAASPVCAEAGGM